MRWSDGPGQNKRGSRPGLSPGPATGRHGLANNRMVRIPRPSNDNQQAAERRLLPRLIIHSLIVLTLLALALSRAFDLF